MGMEKYERVARLPDDEALFAHVGGAAALGAGEGRRAAEPSRVSGFPEGGGVPLLGSERFGVPRSVLDAADEVAGDPHLWGEPLAPRGGGGGDRDERVGAVKYAGGRTVWIRVCARERRRHRGEG